MMLEGNAPKDTQSSSSKPDTSSKISSKPHVKKKTSQAIDEMLTSSTISMTSSACKKCVFFLLVSQVFVVGVIYYTYNHVPVWTISPVTRSPNNANFESTNHTLIHRESHMGLSHVFDTTSNQIVTSIVQDVKPGRVKIAIGLGLTTRKLHDIEGDRMQARMPFFHSLLSSFCKTCSDNYDYHFFLAYDYNDPFMSKSEFLIEFGRQFSKFTDIRCLKSSSYVLHFVKCNHTKKPAWAQNDAMLEAYISGMDYFYRVNDDTVMKTTGWTEIFIRQLEKFNPPRVGVVGPHHTGGNMVILTYDFTHRTHFEIHGFYYPRFFTDWYADKWVTDVYKPGRSIKIKEVLLVHTMENGQRYSNIPKAASVVAGQIERDRATVLRYVSAKETGFRDRDPRKVISISLTANDSDTLWGAVRNAQLAPVIFPGWTIRFYTMDDTSPTAQKIPDSIVRVLRNLSADVVSVRQTSVNNIPSCALNYLAADDPEVNIFLLRNAKARLNERDVAAVNRWLEGDLNKTVHSIKDNLWDNKNSIVNGQWGARRKGLSDILHQTMYTLLAEFMESNVGDVTRLQCNEVLNSFLNTYILDRIKADVLCHDSVSCDKPAPFVVQPFPMLRKSKSFVGQTYNAHESPVTSGSRIAVLVNRKINCEAPS